MILNNTEHTHVLLLMPPNTIRVTCAMLVPRDENDVLSLMQIPSMWLQVVAACIMSACTHALLGSLLAGFWNATGAHLLIP